MVTDRFGSEVTLVDPAALGHWNALQQAFLAHGATAPDHLARTLQAAPDFALGHATKGLLLMLLGRRELVATACEALAQARATASGDWREARFTTALAAWLDGNPSRSAQALEFVLARHPADALAMKAAHAIRFILGDRAEMLATLETIAPAWEAGHPAFGYFLGCRAFALEESGAYAEARRAGTEGLGHAADDAWGLHAVAHVHDMTGDSAGGLAWLAANEGGWAHCNNFRFHVWWHKALMHLDQDDTGAALALYDTQVRAERTDDYRDIANATSLLMRLELEGVAIGDRWEELADLAERRSDDGCLIFADLHYLLALVGGDRNEAARRLVARIVRDGTGAATDLGRRCADPGRAAAEGLEAFGEGAYARAFGRLAAARGALQRAGGSHAQRDVFERLTIDAGIRAGRLHAAAALLDDRTRFRGGAVDGFAARRRAMIADLSRPGLALSAE